MKNRFIYLIVAFLVIALGLLSRSISFVPLFIGDVLYAVLIYLLLRFLLPKKALVLSAFFAVVFCYLIEFSQLFTGNDFLVYARSFKLGRLILGQGFLWSDLFFYVVGVLIAYVIDRYFIKKTGGILTS